MKPSRIAFAFALLLLMLALALPAQGQVDYFVLERADASTTVSVTASSNLNALIDTVEVRFVLQHANANLYHSVGPPPAEFGTLLHQIRDRFVFRFANANRLYVLGYPIDLIGDTTAPAITDSSVTTLSDEDVVIIWTTDEYTVSVLEYGSEPGTYTQSVADDLYSKNHEVALTGLEAGETYYYRISNTDRSGNTSRSPEYSFTVAIRVYLPIVVR